MRRKKNKLTDGNEQVSGDVSKPNRTVMYIFVGLIIGGILAIFMFGPNGFLASDKEGMCIPTDNSIYESMGSGKYIHQASGAEIIVIRGLRNGTIDIHQRKDASMPACFSSDRGLMSVYNLTVFDPNSNETIVFPAAVIAKNDDLLN